MLTFKNCKKIYNLLCETIFQAFFTCIFYSFPIFTPGKQPYFEISAMTTHTPCARGIWWTLDFASAFLSPGVNSRAELVPSPRAYARNGAPRRWLGGKRIWTYCRILKNVQSFKKFYRRKREKFGFNVGKFY
jgi:hypothetical protein